MMNKNDGQNALALSVIVPCYNPRREYLERTLDALRRQTLPFPAWDLVVIDNASDPCLSSWLDISWHPHGRMVREDTQGLTAARLRGFAETKAGLVLMVDDDNVLARDYLERATRIGSQKPFLGTFGGAIEPEFEIQPLRWMRPYLGMLGVRDVPASVWSNDMNHWPSTPIGAGMCLRRNVAEAYRDAIERQPLRKKLDRHGNSLVSGGDIDIAFTGLSIGLGMGVFKELRLTHLIPTKRLNAPYLEKLSESIGYSSAMLDSLWEREGHTLSSVPSFSTLCQNGAKALLACLRKRRYIAARHRGEARGQQFLRDSHKNEASPAVES